MSELLEKTKNYAIGLLSNQLDANYLYHNLRHTERVVKSTKELLNFYTLDSKENEALIIAAWLHDTGYIKGYKNHEESSCEIAAGFLKENNVPKETIQLICSLIKATKRNYTPKNIAEEILRDADSSHFAQKSYLETSEYLREEFSLIDMAKFSKGEWRKENIKMFTSEHEYFTDYAKENWQTGKDKNLKKLTQNKKEEKIAKKEALKAKYKNESPDRGIQTLYRVTLKNHITLSNIADTKANILLSVNAIIISLALSSLIPKLDNPSNEYLLYPTIIFIVFSVVSMVLAVLATRPNVTSGEFTKDDVKK